MSADAPRLELLEEVAQDGIPEYVTRFVHDLPDPGPVSPSPELRASVRRVGVLSPVWIDAVTGEILDGRRRIAAARAVLPPDHTVPVLLSHTTRRAGRVLTLLGNWVRSPNLVHEAMCLRELVVDGGLSAGDVARELDVPLARVEALLRLALAAPWIREGAARGAIKPTVAMAAAGLETSEQIALEAQFRTAGKLHHRDVRDVRRRVVASALPAELFAGPSHEAMSGAAATVAVPTPVTERLARLLHALLKQDGAPPTLDQRQECARLSLELESVLIDQGAA